MSKFEVTAKFDIGDTVYGFVENGLHKVTIDSVEIVVTKFSNFYTTRQEVRYKATLLNDDGEHHTYYNLKESDLFTREELISYIENSLKKLDDNDKRGIHKKNK